MTARPLCLASHHFPADHLTDGVRSLHAHAGRGVDVGAEREPRAVMSEHFGECPHIHAVFECQGRECVPKLVEAENRALLVVAESRICYNADRLWFCRSLFCIRRRGLRMARKSRKRQTVTLPHLHSETAGYIRLSVTGKGGDDSIENQKKVIEAWARENQHPISCCMQSFSRPRIKSVVPSAELLLRPPLTASNTARTAGSVLPADRQRSA